jgi:hypothetical protein
MERRRSSENKRNWESAGVSDQFSKSGRWASPIFFVPGTLVRTWGTRRLPPRLFEREALLQSFYLGGWNAGDGGNVLPGFEIAFLIPILHDGFRLWLG